MSLIGELADLERRGWESLCDGTGHRFYEDLMTDDGLMVVADGTVLDRDQVVAALAGSPPWLRYEITGERLVRLPDGGALVYRASAWHSEDEPPFVAAMASVYVRQGDRWRLAFYQQTLAA